MKIAVFCSANDGLDSDFLTLTTQLGQWMAREGHALVFGGTDMGLMECVARAVHDGGGRVIGIVPTMVERRGHTSALNDVEIPCDNLADRKALMELQADLFVALPGGIGTLDEVFTVAAGATIGYHHKRVVLYNMKGFWNPLVALLDHLQAQGLVRGSWRDRILVADSLDDIARAVEELNEGAK